jgi:hypothetical protein
MNFRLNTRYEEMCLVIKVAVNMPAKVRLKIFDEQKPKIVFTEGKNVAQNACVM